MTRRLALLPLLLTLALDCSLARAGDEATSEAWFVISKGDVPFCSRHVSRERDGDGNWRYHCVTRELISFLGRQQERVEDFSCVVTPSLEPLSCRYESRSASGDVRVTGSVQDGTLVLAFKRGDLEYERRIPLAGRCVFDTCLSDQLAEASRRSDSLELTVIETDSWQAARATAKRLPDEEGLVRWKLSADAMDTGLPGKGTWFFSTDGTLERASLGSKLTLARAMRERAGELKHLEFSDRELLSFAIDRDVPFPERLRSMEVKLTWTGTPLDVLQLEDSRQHVVSHRQKGDRHELVLRLEQAAPVDNAPPLPVADAALAPYLAETRFIKPHDPTIAKKAREWTAGCGSTLDAVQRLSHEVSGYLQGGDLIAETLSGPEVLACRTGKCSEFTTLLASLARSVGVPTRVALGMRLLNGCWMGHMWCEMWVGEWIPVDATVDEVGGSPALLKITHSDTVTGTQRARFALAESLDLKIVEVELPPASDSKYKTGIVGSTYTNTDHGCRISAPDAKWQVLDDSKPGAVTVQFKTGEKFAAGQPQVHFVAFSMPPNVPPAVVVNARKARFQSSYKGFEVVADEKTMVGDDQGRRFVFRQQDPKSEERRIKTTEFVWSHGGSGFLLNLIAEETVHDAVLPQVEAVLKSFEVLATPEPPAGK